ncbi:phytanoyl-CoA dioxygenase family protein [Pararhizobium haloflavum]|uniref:phytanoyl-CoA dioxygenase family protein n=1 Tax=Pararhizobium haloflavum TaxID=2037914 RepID=UPI001FE0DEFA|nr:phytanoyl-CoA dioxygenase family protein [Pararhizobium haloflavum]
MQTAAHMTAPVDQDGHGDHPTAMGVTTQLKDIEKRLPLRVLSESDWHHWITRGYVIIKSAVPRSQCDAVIDMLWDFQEMDRNDPNTWYRPQLRDYKMKELNNAGMVEVYNHQTLWENRQSERVYNAFVDIWDRENLWVAIDRANLNPPNKAARAAAQENGFIHFDVDSSARPFPIGVQGVLSLAPQNRETGGFQCVPDLFAELEAWCERQPADRNPFKPDITGYDIVNIDMEPGDLLIFNSLLPHGVRPNRSENKVRMAQYISMFPGDPDNAKIRDERIRLWREREAPHGDPFPGDPRGKEKSNPVATLTPLGRKLLGLDRW